MNGRRTARIGINARLTPPQAGALLRLSSRVRVLRPFKAESALPQPPSLAQKERTP